MDYGQFWMELSPFNDATNFAIYNTSWNFFNIYYVTEYQ